MAKKSAIKNRQPSMPMCKAHFRRDAVVRALGEGAAYGLPDSYYIRRGHICRAYGLSTYQVTVLVEAGTLKEVHLSDQCGSDRSE